MEGVNDMAISAWTPLTLKYLCMYNVQKVLPAVYDDSLSYYELLAKIQDKLNEVIHSENYLNEWQAAQDELMADLEQLVQDFINGGYKQDFDQFAQDWLDANIQEALTKAAHMVFFGLTEDGYFTAYIPRDWSFVFDTIIDYNDPNYGSLTIKY